MTEPFKMIEMALKELIERELPNAEGRVGGDLSFDPATQDFYVWLGLVPGGTADQISGSWILDIDVFAKGYVEAVTLANALEAVLLRPRHTTSEMRIDNTYQNTGPTERPWDDESVFRVGGTYVFTARRSG